MRRFAVLTISIAAACGGGKPSPTAVTPPAPPIDAAPPPVSAAERAVAAHREQLLDHPGVVDVVAAPGGDGLVIELCAAEAAYGLDLASYGAPATTATGDWKQTARGERCGCVSANMYLRDGEEFDRPCQRCACNGECGAVAGCDDLMFAFQKPPPLVFGLDSAIVDRSVPLDLQPIAELVESADAEYERHHWQGTTTVAIHGHAGPRERRAQKLSEERAAVARELLLKQTTLEPARVVKVDGLGATGADADPVVTFEIIRPAPTPLPLPR